MSNPHLHANICRAIQERRLLEIEYHGHARTIAPHIYGIDTTGDEMLSAYQVWGGSDGGDQTGWKSLKVREISSLAVTTRKFTPRREFRKGDGAMREIFCEV